MTTQPSEKLTALIPANPALFSWIWIQPSEVLDARHWGNEPATQSPTEGRSPHQETSFHPKGSARTLDLLAPLRTYLNNLDIRHPHRAHFICRHIPTQCPFERDIQVFGKTLFHIPPLCKLNPLYEEVVALRFRALCYLADECGEDVTPYC